MRTTVASAPGKALVTGGYLVTERPNPGTVLTLDARFYAVIRSRPGAPDRHALPITSVSPQFRNSERGYQYLWNPQPRLQPECASSPHNSGARRCSRCAATAIPS